MKEIILSTGLISLVDDDMYPLLNNIPWHQYNGGHPYTDSIGIQISMHLYIFKLKNINIPSTYEIDHIDRNPLNNQFTNLRIVTHSMNTHNSWNKSNTSGVRGVHWDKRRNIWRAIITNNGVYMQLGQFHKYEDAVFARRNAETRLGLIVPKEG